LIIFYCSIDKYVLFGSVDIFIILYMIYLLLFYLLSFFFCNIMFLLFPSFFLIIFLGKNIIFYFLHLEYLLLYTWLIYTFLFVLISILLQFFFLIFFLKKIIIQKLRKLCFSVAITVLFYFSNTLKISLRSYMSLLTHIIFTIFYYM
jgi:hypothetical protein